MSSGLRWCKAVRHPSAPSSRITLYSPFKVILSTTIERYMMLCVYSSVYLGQSPDSQRHLHLLLGHHSQWLTRAEIRLWLGTRSNLHWLHRHRSFPRGAVDCWTLLPCDLRQWYACTHFFSEPTLASIGVFVSLQEWRVVQSSAVSDDALARSAHR